MKYNNCKGPNPSHQLVGTIGSEGLLSAIGRTPLVKLLRLSNGGRFHVFAKLELMNPSGSLKDRSALTIIQSAHAQGLIRSGSTVVESSSGNFAIALAQVCKYLDMKLVCVVDSRATMMNVEILRAHGARVVIVSAPDPTTGDLLTARINMVKQILRDQPDAFWPDQYSNCCNALAHRQTMREIVEELDGRIDYLFCAVSTCGTIRGCSDYSRGLTLPIKIIAVDAVGSVIFGHKPCDRLLPGHGASRRPELFQPGLVDSYVHVSDLECVVGCRRLLKAEAILAGGSSGAVVAALERMAPALPSQARCVLILPDRGERYLDTVFSDKWVSDHFGDVSKMWEDYIPWQPRQTLLTVGSSS